MTVVSQTRFQRRKLLSGHVPNKKIPPTNIRVLGIFYALIYDFQLLRYKVIWHSLLTDTTNKYLFESPNLSHLA